MSLILGIETSCDETAAAVVENGYNLKSNIISSQIKLHAKYGGVVPELAAREHLKAISHVTKEALETAKVTLQDISALAVTNGPGLIPALLVGLNFARGLSSSNEIPLIGVNHFFSHIYSSFMKLDEAVLKDKETYPILALVVSGGHTSLVFIQSDSSAKVIGYTIGDAAGEALDKGAKLLNLGYPGGPIIDNLAKKGDMNKFHFPRSLTGSAGKPLSEENRYNFSFSGLKTSLLYHVEKNGGTENIDEHFLYDTVASYQYAVVDVLCLKTLKAAKDLNARRIVLCGGVAQNSLLREELKNRTPKQIKIHLAPKEFCGDNAAMVAGLGWHYLSQNMIGNLSLDAYSRLPVISKVPFVSL